MDFPSKMMQSTAVQTLKDSKSELNDSLDNLSAIEHNDSSLSAIDALIKGYILIIYTLNKGLNNLKFPNIYKYKVSDNLKKKLVSLKKNILATDSNKQT